MLGKLLKKEWALCMHPAAWIMLGLSTLILIPNYPYNRRRKRERLREKKIKKKNRNANR